MTEIDNIVAEIKQATDYQANRRTLREHIQTELHMTYSNGLFKVTPELIAFVATWNSDEMYIEDTYENPIKVNRTEFLELAQQRYQAVMNDWHQQYNELRRLRRV
jgi:hypothetical protein